MNPDGKLPILDLKVWVDCTGRILYEFYRKPMASRLLILSRSAMSERVKRTTLVQEAIRILKNTSPDVPWKNVEVMLSDFSLRMKQSGYPEKYRENVILSALSAWEKMVELDRTGVKPLHRERSWREEERRKEKEKKKTNWFRGKGGQKYDFPIFCPITPGDRLAEKWKKVAEEMRVSTGGEVCAKVVEQGGVPIHTVLVKPMPQQGDICTKGDCIPCRSGQTKNQSCHKGAIGGVGYEQQCLICLEDQKVAIYHGESSRTLYTRSKEHCAGLRQKKADNPMHKHQANFHPGLEADFSIKATRFFNDPLTRQINEGSG